MLYYIDGKFYILANNKYREVTVTKHGKEYNVEVVPNSKKIEYVHNESRPQVSVEEAYNKINANSKREII